MKSLDTNVLARFFIDDSDDPEAAKQRPAAASAMAARAFVTVTVLLEFEWVMRGFYGLRPQDVVSVMRALIGIEHITIEDRDSILAACDALERGVDFADALHLTRSARASSFVTFDQRLAKRSMALEIPTPVELLS